MLGFLTLATLQDVEAASGDDSSVGMILDQESINWELNRAVLRNDLDAVREVLDPEAACLPDVGALNGALCNASSQGYLDIVDYIMNSEDPSPLCPDQSGVNRAIELAAINGKVEIIEYFLSSSSSLKLYPSQRGVNLCLAVAAERLQPSVINLLLEPRHDLKLRPNRDGIDMALWGSVYSRYRKLTACLLSPLRPEELRPSQRGIDIALRNAAIDGDLDTVDYFLSPKFRISIHPSNEEIFDIYDALRYSPELYFIRNYIRTYLPEEHRLFIASEIPRAASAGRVSLPRRSRKAETSN